MTMKNFTRLISILLALLALPMCLFACEQGGKGNEEGTIDPNDTPDGLRVDINIRSLSTVEGELGDYFIKTGKDFRIEPGTTLLAAVEALCTERQATCVVDTAGDFASFTFDGSTLETEHPEYDIPDMYLGESRGFLESIETGIPDRNNIENILESAKLLDSLYASAEAQKEIAF